jgi:uncharacterized membrane protein YczE
LITVWFTFGMAEYCFQLLLIIVLSLLMLKFKKKFIFSFVTAFIYGNILDLVMWIMAFPGSKHWNCDMCTPKWIYNRKMHTFL